MKKYDKYGSSKRRCECGFIVRAHSEKHLDANMKIHEKSTKHEELMEIKRSAK